MGEPCCAVLGIGFQQRSKTAVRARSARSATEPRAKRRISLELLRVRAKKADAQAEVRRAPDGRDPIHLTRARDSQSLMGQPDGEAQIYRWESLQAGKSHRRLRRSRRRQHHVSRSRGLGTGRRWLRKCDAELVVIERRFPNGETMSRGNNGNTHESDSQSPNISISTSISRNGCAIAAAAS